MDHDRLRAAYLMLQAAPPPGDPDPETDDLGPNMGDFETTLNRHVASGLGLVVHPPSNFPEWTVTEDKWANPYRDEDRFRYLPDYVGKWDAARTAAPDGLLLTLRQEGDAWVASYRFPDGGDAGEGTAPTPARATLLAALATRMAVPGDGAAVPG